MNASSYERLIEGLPLGVLVTDPDGSVTVVNSLALEMLGLPRRVAERSRVHELVPMAAEAFGAPVTTTTRVEVDDRRLLLETRPVEGVHGPRLVTLRDVTDAGDARRMKEAFLGDLLHRMRTPLTAIKSSLSMIHRGGYVDASSDAASLIDAGHVATGQMVRLLDDVRDLFRIDTGLLDDDPTQPHGDVDLTDVLERVQIRLESTASARERSIRIQTVTPDDAVVIRSNEDLLVGALRRVTENAVAHSPGDGVVTLSLRPEPEQVEITVSDSGAGLGDEEEMRAFDRFYRGPTAATRAPDGLGLGLPIARGFVRHLGGEIELETKPGSGTRVSILLPRGPAA